ncbi:MAG: M48 family metallopeptidase [Bacteroidota bacterium]|nr:M48 family metallopeptidase [Bacteroidota bacterium]MDX5431280.1 M48 family metallopeptidase [Bacteroidota bacterium]MDX5470018.1 M48 family metallopeptidase [Bacteroidota bacterium]
MLTLNLAGKKEWKLCEEFVESLSSSLQQSNQNGQLSVGDSLSLYLQGIADRLAEANGLQKNYYRVILHLDPVPNASNYGEGIILFNLGLLAQLPSESHIAFILGHEMAHDVQDHVFKGIESKVRVIQGEEYQNAITAIEKESYNRLALVRNLNRKMLSQFNEHGRENELEADSLAFVYLRKAGYWLPGASQALMLLDSCDEIPSFKLDIKSFYTFQNYPFQDKWLEKENNPLLGGNLEFFRLPDSLKTHPSCALRDSLVMVLYNSVDMDSLTGIRFSKRNRQTEMARFELLEWLKNHGYYAELQYRTFILQSEYPENIYLKNTVGLAMYGLFTALHGRMYSRAVPFASANTKPEYAEFLQYLHKLNLSALKGQYTAYVQERIPEEGVDDFSDMLYTLTKLLDEEDPEEKQYIISEYASKYGETVYTNYLKKQFPDPKPSKKKKK